MLILHSIMNLRISQKGLQWWTFRIKAKQGIFIILSDGGRGFVPPDLNYYKM